jgi:transposase
LNFSWQIGLGSLRVDLLKEVELDGYVDSFVLKGLDLQIVNYESEHKRHKDEFNRLKKTWPEIKRVSEIPGIGEIGAMKIISRIVDAYRFPTRNNF